MAIESAEDDNRMVILVIEDEPLIRTLVSEYIAEAGFETLQAANADVAIEILESRDDIRAIFTDINMPGSMDGLKLARAVRDRWPPIKIVVVSGQVKFTQNDLPEGSRFFGKPFETDKMISELRSMIAG